LFLGNDALENEMKSTFLSVLLFAASHSAFGQLPDFYKSVDRATWVVKDLDRVTAAWEKIGISEIRQLGETASTDQYRGKSVASTVRIATGRAGSLHIIWMQPLTKGNAYSDFLEKHGEGLFSFVHRVPSAEALEQEIKRLGGAGAGVLQRGSFDTDAGPIVYAQMDTEPQGKYSLGLFYFPPGIEDAINVPANPSGPKLSQYAIVARDLRAVSTYWHKLGFPEMTYTHGPMTDTEYRGRQGQFDQELGWHRYGSIVYEWIQALKGPTVYEDFIKAHGEGIQHLGVDVPDMDKAISDWKRLGYPVSQAGGWGEKGKPGSGRFAYIDTEPAGGLTIELLWNYR
jgi:hypothetical protein